MNTHCVYNDTKSYMNPHPCPEHSSRTEKFHGKSKQVKPVPRGEIQHYLNALHLYSLLLRLRVRKGIALTMAKAWEWIVHDLIY